MDITNETIINKLTYTDVLHWNTDEVSKFLLTTIPKFKEYATIFKEHDINGEAFLELKSLKEFQLLKITKLGHILLLQKFIRMIRNNQ
jgi:hypothetical protein